MVISFIDDFKITKTDLVAELFHLEKKKIIDIWYIIGIAILILHFYYAYFDSYNKRYRFLSRKLSYARSEKGEELNEKIEGLKNFTKDYTLLDERTLEEITLWEDYLVYSVLWGQNEKEIKKYKQYVGFDEEVS